MSAYLEAVAQHRRLTILRTLQQAPDYRCNDSILTSIANTVGLRASRDQIAGDLAWLVEQQLATTETLEGGLIVATATRRGCEVAQGIVIHPGVQRPSPR